KQGDRVAARIVPMMRRHVFTGGFLPFTSEASEMLFDALRRMHGKKGAKKLPAISDPDLQGAASLFTVTWLADVFGRVDTPEVRNAEGEEFLFHDVRFPLASGVRQKDVVPRLDAMPALVKESARAWSWLEDEAPSASKEPQAGRITLDRTTLSDGPRILGNVDLKGRFVRLATNSQGRAEK